LEKSLQIFNNISLLDFLPFHARCGILFNMKEFRPIIISHPNLLSCLLCLKLSVSAITGTQEASILDSLEIMHLSCFEKVKSVGLTLFSNLNQYR